MTPERGNCTDLFKEFISTATIIVSRKEENKIIITKYSCGEFPAESFHTVITTKLNEIFIEQYLLRQIYFYHHQYHRDINIEI